MDEAAAAAAEDEVEVVVEAAAVVTDGTAKAVAGAAAARVIDGTAARVVKACVEIKFIQRVRPESPRRPSRHRCGTCSVAWQCRVLTARRS